MSSVKTIIICFTATIILALVPGLSGQAVDPNCLGCICEASTSCNATAGCHTPYPGGYFCGPFLISWAYWADAGKPVIQHDDPDRKGAFENCVNDLYCAAETVRQYMKKFFTDCTTDGVVNCADYSRIHKLGYGACNVGFDASNPYWQSYQACASTLGVQ